MVLHDLEINHAGYADISKTILANTDNYTPVIL